MNFVFFGSDELSVKVLETLKQRGFLPALIVTVPDKPKGRKLVMTPPPVKVWAQDNGIALLQPSKVSELLSSPYNLQPRTYDLFVVASYGKIIPQSILDLPKQGTLNVHPSLLPKYRGPSPLEYQILNGDEEVGVTIMLVDAEMDHGNIVQSTKYKVQSDETYEELRDILAEKGGEMLAEVMPKWITGEIKAVPQDHDQATFTKKIEKEDGLIDLAGDPIVNYRKYLAYHSWPGTYFFVNKNDQQIRIVIKSAHLEKGNFVVDRVVPEGKSEMNWSDFARNL